MTSRSIAVIDAEQVRAALPFEALIPELRTAFGSAMTVPKRHHHDIWGAQGQSGALLVMPAWTEALLGTKIATIFPANSCHGLSSVHAAYLLWDATNGMPLALIDGDQITRRRTIAASALAASFLAREDAEALLVVGTGEIAALAAEAFSIVRPIAHVLVWGRDPGKADALAARLCTQGFDAIPVVDLARAVSRADIVSCATPSTSPLIQGGWLQPGTHLDLIGSFAPAMREADEACFLRAAIYVDTLEALGEAGDLIDPIASGAISVDSVCGTLADLCAGRSIGRTSVKAITLYKSVGTALADLAAAALVHARSASKEH